MTMDTLLKERLVGAMVLVLAAVIFIPVVLDGPDSTTRVSRSVALPEPGGADDDRRTVRIDLAGQDAGIEMQPAVTVEEPASIDLTGIDADTGSTADTASANTADAGSPPADGATTPAPVVSSRETPEPVAVQPWTVQVGSFSNDANAERLAARLRELGFPAYVSRFEDGNTVHHRVRVGGFPSRDAAQAEADAVREKTGQPARPARNL
ncbi:MAG TPA: SPOR domain-containing protein [Gammaproteobacteria bacterium]